MAKAILLLSGGLDSSLAGKVLLEQGVQVEAINFVSPFCCCTPRAWGCSAARKAAGQLGITVHVLNCGADYLEVMKRPRFGRGRGMNACLDCRIHMFSRARAFMKEQGADFVATGEVVGERPMSQRRDAMRLIERESGLEGLLVRALCAQLLPPSLPEKRRLVDRSRLEGIRGRSRRPQMALAEALGLTDYPCPAGGCLLTDAVFAARFRDLLEHDPGFGLPDARLLRYGRQFRLPGGTKVIMGRDDSENKVIEYADSAGDTLLVPRGAMGPSALCRRGTTPQDTQTAASMVAAYTKGGTEIDVAVQEITESGTHASVFERVSPLGREAAATWRIGAQAVQVADPRGD